MSQSKKKYDAIIVNLPEPNTYQVNRFYTDVFFEIASNHLVENGVLSFSMQGFDTYLAEPQRQKLSSLYNTAKTYFKHVLLLPGRKIYFLCRNSGVNIDIPTALEKKGISTAYLSGFFYGNLSSERIHRLNTLLDPSTPRNVDHSPYLMRLMFSSGLRNFKHPRLVFIS